MKNINIHKLNFSKGLTLIEVIVSILVLSLIIVVVSPSVMTYVRTTRAERDVVGSMDYILQAATNFYNGSESNLFTTNSPELTPRWPNDISEMKSYGYIPETWSEINPWGNPYVVSSPTPYIFTVSTVIPKDLVPAVKGKLKFFEYTESGDTATIYTSTVIQWKDPLTYVVLSEFQEV